jgi:hypothetical protein
MDHLHELFGIEPGHPDSVFGLTLALRLRELETAAPVPRLMQYGGRVLPMAASVLALAGAPAAWLVAGDLGCGADTHLPGSHSRVAARVA